MIFKVGDYVNFGYTHYTTHLTIDANQIFIIDRLYKRKGYSGDMLRIVYHLDGLEKKMNVPDSYMEINIRENRMAKLKNIFDE
jgi:hypothetical protein